MRKITLRSITCFMFLALASCVAAPPVVIAPFDKALTIEKSLDEVWPNLVRFLSTNDISIQTIEKESGLIQLNGENLSQGVLDQLCVASAGLLEIPMGGTARGSITVFEDDTFSTISVNIRFSKISRFGDYAPTIADCQSRGVFETAVLNSVR